MFGIIMTLLAVGLVLYLAYRAMAFLALMVLFIPRLIYIVWCTSNGQVPKPWWPFNKTKEDTTVIDSAVEELECRPIGSWSDVKERCAPGGQIRMTAAEFQACLRSDPKTPAMRAGR